MRDIRWTGQRGNKEYLELNQRLEITVEPYSKSEWQVQLINYTSSCDKEILFEKTLKASKKAVAKKEAMRVVMNYLEEVYREASEREYAIMTKVLKLYPELFSEGGKKVGV